jgi:hypothetical protein
MSSASLTSHLEKLFCQLTIFRLRQDGMDHDGCLQAGLQGQVHALRRQRIHAETGIPNANVLIADGVCGVLAGRITSPWIGTLSSEWG